MSDVANETRGEVSISLEGVDYVLRPSWEAIDAVESKLGKSLEQLASAANASLLTLYEKATLCGEFIRVWGKQEGKPAAAGVNDERLKQLIVQEGSLVIGRRLGLVMFMAVTGGIEATGKAKPPTMETSLAAVAEQDGSPA